MRWKRRGREQVQQSSQSQGKECWEVEEAGRGNSPCIVFGTLAVVSVYVYIYICVCVCVVGNGEEEGVMRVILYSER